MTATDATPTRERRPLTPGEIGLARGVFGAAIDYARVRLVPRKWAFFQPRDTVMAPWGHIHFHPRSPWWCADFAASTLVAKGLFLHEMVHVWQHQAGHWLPIERHPFCRYGYTLEPGTPFARYGIEQQAEIVRHAFLAREQGSDAGPLAAILPFSPA